MRILCLHHSLLSKLCLAHDRAHQPPPRGRYLLFPGLKPPDRRELSECGRRFRSARPANRATASGYRSISVPLWCFGVFKAHGPVPVTPLPDGSGFGLIFPGSWRPSGRQTQGRQDPERCRRAHDGAEHHGPLTGRTEHGINAEHLP